MTEAQAMALARKLFLDSRGTDFTLNTEEVINRIKEAIMDAYNSGWENGYEEGKEDMR